MHQAVIPNNGDTDVGGQQGPGVKRLSGWDKRLKYDKKPGLLPKTTPNRPISLRDNSRASSSSSSSTNSTVFDIDSSPVGTPRTPPTGPNFSLRLRTANPENGSAVSSEDQIPGEKNYFDASPPSPSVARRGKARHSFTSQFQEQDSQLEVPGKADDTSALDDSPTAKKQDRSKQENAFQIDLIAKKLRSMSLRGNDISRRNKMQACETGNVSLKLDPEAKFSHILESEKDAFNGEDDASRDYMPEVQRASQTVTGGAHQGGPLSSKIPPSRVAKSASKSRKSAKPRKTNHFDIEVGSVGEPQGQRRQGYRSSAVSLQAPLSGSPRRRSPRLASSTSDSRASEGHIIDQSTRYNSSATPSRTSELVEQESKEQEPVEPEPAESVNFSRSEDASSSNEQLQTTCGRNIRRNPPPADPEFENFKAERAEKNYVKNDILRVIRRQDLEDSLAEESDTPFILLLPSTVRNWWYPKRTVSKQENKTDGFIYIYKHKERPGYFKIGKTQDTPEKRIRAWRRKCGFDVIHVSDPKDKIFRHFAVIESLIMAELSNERMKLKCTRCRKDKIVEHIEWYKISEKHALQVVQKWRRWIVERQPYMHHGVLRDFWKWKYDQAMVKDVEIDWTTWCLFSWVDIFRYGFYCIYTTIERAAPALVAVGLGPGIIFLIIPILAIYHTGTCIIVGVSGVTATICIIAFRFLFC